MTKQGHDYVTVTHLIHILGGPIKTRLLSILSYRALSVVAFLKMSMGYERNQNQLTLDFAE